MSGMCSHQEAKPVLTIGKCEVWGGRQTQVMPIADQFDCIISLLGNVHRSKLQFSLSRGSRRMFRNLANYQQRRNNLVCIDWPDMQAPPLDKGFWEALALDLSGITGRAAMFCIGGHGRTGTALCSLIQVTKYVPAMESGDILRWVRENYCQSAVETDSQIQYLKKVMGVQTTVEGYKVPKSSMYWGKDRESRTVTGLLSGSGIESDPRLDDEENFRGQGRY